MPDATLTSVRMKVSVFLVLLCLADAFAQLLVPQTQFPPNIDRTRQLSIQQQGQILSDIQQHQHRFDLSQNRQQYHPQHFTRQQVVPQNGIFNQQQIPRLTQQQLLYQQRLLQQQYSSQSPLAEENLARNEFLNTLPLVQALPQNILPTPQVQPQVQQPLPVLPTIPSKQDIQQYHTQTSFTPNFANQPRNNQQISEDFNQQYIKPRPTQDPIALIEYQIKQLDPEKHKQKIKELREKQAIIEKHNQFVEKQYEKALKKAREEHQEFIDQQKEQKKKIYERLYNVANGESVHYSTSTKPRVIYPEEASLFAQAVKQFYIEHPTKTTTTTTTTTTPTTTPKPSTVKENTKTELFLPTALPSARIKEIQSLEDLDQLQKQYRSQRIRKDDLLEQLRLAISKSSEDDIAKNLSSREIALSSGKKAQIVSTSDPNKLPKGTEEEITLPDGKKVTVIRADNADNPKDEEITLPSGHQVQIIRTNDPKAVPDSLEEITLPNGQKGKLVKQTNTNARTLPVFKTQEITLPNGEKVEVIKTTDPNLVPGGGVKIEPGSELEKLVFSRTTTIKPPTAVLEELTKDVPNSNYEILKTGASGGLESIGKNLPNQKKVTFVLLEEQSDGTLKVQGIKGNGKDKQDIDVESILKKIRQGEIKLPSTQKPTTTTQVPTVTTTIKPITQTITTNAFTYDDDDSSSTYNTASNLYDDKTNVPILKTNIGTNIVASSTATSLFTKEYSASTGTAATTKKTSRTPHIINYSVADLVRQETSDSASVPISTTATLSSTTVRIDKSVSPQLTASPTKETYKETTVARLELPDILKKQGLYAMAKFLKQSGLDTILNETGPYTLFVPTDKAFRTLLIQLGGPERAEEKFKENPRLLSGLLLHHVIPGSFKIEALQDEMTGVSLAGTQLRVNQYNMHDVEWNDIKITTINGAKIQEDQKDIEIRQGIAHAIDRVMFPLPVGDLVQTLQSDRERRFTSFLRAIYSSGLAEMLQGTKTYTLFAPTEKAFAELSSSDLTRTVTDKVLARELVLKHLLAGTLFTNGMRYYQIKDSLMDDRQLTFSKQSGKAKVNNIHIGTANIPATNGVIHTIDSLL